MSALALRMRTYSVEPHLVDGTLGLVSGHLNRPLASILVCGVLPSRHDVVLLVNDRLAI